MQDPHPGKMALTEGEVAKLLSMSKDTLKRVMDEDATFPRPVMVGKPTARKSSRYRWDKWDVLAWFRTRERVVELEEK